MLGVGVNSRAAEVEPGTFNRAEICVNVPRAAKRPEVAVVRDIKDVIGVIMRVLNGAEITEDDVLDLEFEADGELLAALNVAYIKLLEFVHDRDRRLSDSQLDQRARASLQDVLSRIVHLSDAASG